MKRALLLSTALVPVMASTAIAQAHAQTKAAPIQISVGGYMGSFIGYVDQDDRGAVAGGSSGKLTKVDQQQEQEIHFNGRTTLDNGLTIGLRIELEGSTDSTDQIDESYMFLDGRFGRFEFGNINNVSYRMHFDAPDVFVRGWLAREGDLSNWTVNPTGSSNFDSTIRGTFNRFFDNDSEKMNYYTPRFEGFQVGISYVPNSSQDRQSPEAASTAYSRGWAASANYVREFGALKVLASAGYFTWQGPQTGPNSSAPDPDAYNFGLRLGYAGFEIGGSYARISDGRTGSSGTAFAASTAGAGSNMVEGRAYSLGASYTFGPASVSLTYADGRNDDSPVAGPNLGDDKFSGLSLAGTYTLGPGVRLSAVGFFADFEGNTPNTNTDDNEAAGVIAGIFLNF